MDQYCGKYNLPEIVGSYGRYPGKTPLMNSYIRLVYF